MRVVASLGGTGEGTSQDFCFHLRCMLQAALFCSSKNLNMYHFCTNKQTIILEWLLVAKGSLWCFSVVYNKPTNISMQ